MTKDRQVSLHNRRQVLIELAAAQREALACELDKWRSPLARVSQVLKVLQLVRRYASWLLVGVATLGALRRLKAGTLLQRAALVWRIVRLVRGTRPGNATAGPG